MSLPCLNCSFFTVRSISCLTRPFCSAGATSAGVLPLRISWVVRAEWEQVEALLKMGWANFTFYSPLSTVRTVVPWTPAAKIHSRYMFLIPREAFVAGRIGWVCGSSGSNTTHAIRMRGSSGTNIVLEASHSCRTILLKVPSEEWG
jgi:hypothetical protein